MKAIKKIMAIGLPLCMLLTLVNNISLAEETEYKNDGVIWGYTYSSLNLVENYLSSFP